MSLFDLSNALPQLTTQASVPWSETYQLPAGIPTPIAPARPDTTSTTNSDTPETWWQKYLDAFGQAQDNAIDNPANTIANLSGVSPNDLATGKAGISGIPADVVAVLIGLVLVAGAVWSFSTIRDTVITTAKGAATLAA